MLSRPGKLKICGLGLSGARRQALHGRSWEEGNFAGISACEFRPGKRLHSLQAGALLNSPLKELASKRALASSSSRIWNTSAACTLSESLYGRNRNKVSES